MPGHDLRIELAGPVPRNIRGNRADLSQRCLRGGAVAVVPGRERRPLALLITEMTGHFSIQRGLQHRLGHPGQQPARSHQAHAFGLGPFQQLPGDPTPRSPRAR